MMMMMMTREGAGALDRLRGDDPRRGGGCDAHARHVTENPQAPGGRQLEWALLLAAFSCSLALCQSSKLSRQTGVGDS